MRRGEALDVALPVARSPANSSICGHSTCWASVSGYNQKVDGCPCSRCRHSPRRASGRRTLNPRLGARPELRRSSEGVPANSHATVAAGDETKRCARQSFPQRSRCDLRPASLDAQPPCAEAFHQDQGDEEAQSHRQELLSFRRPRHGRQRRGSARFRSDLLCAAHRRQPAGASRDHDGGAPSGSRRDPAAEPVRQRHAAGTSTVEMMERRLHLRDGWTSGSSVFPQTAAESCAGCCQRLAGSW